MAALAIIEKLTAKRSLPSFKALEITCVGPEFISPFDSCAVNSTALVALMGVEQGISPLGDLLYESYFDCLNFLRKKNPMGVCQVNRKHFSWDKEKMVRRFGESISQVRDLITFEEKAHIFYPPVFLSWWQESLTRFGNIRWCSDIVSAVENGIAYGLKDSYEYDFCFDARGSGIKDHCEIKENFKVVPGHFLEWDYKEENGNSWVMTIDGHNLIYHHHFSKLILGGSSEKTEVRAPCLEDLKEQISSFVKLDKKWSKILDIRKATIKTGLRTKASKRMPFLKFQKKNHLLIGGFYKNGYTLCFPVADMAITKFKESMAEERM